MFNRKLLIVETIFCDNERDPAILAAYLKRFFFTIVSFANSDIKDTKVDFIIYLSEDKHDIKLRIETFISNLLFKNRNVSFNIIGYKHPPEGYSFPGNYHIEKVKNPNRMGGLRDRLFSRYQYEDLGYEYVIRMSIDDDDIVAQWHLSNIVHIADLALRKYDAPIVAVGLANAFLVYEEVDEFHVEVIKFTRALNGNKFYVYRKGENIFQYSPWSILEVIDQDNVDVFLQKYNIQLCLVNNVFPGFFYLRRNTNLSNRLKTGFVTKTYSEFNAERLIDLLALSDATKFTLPAHDEFYVDERVLKIRGRITKGFIHFDSNFDKISLAGDQIAFYLYKNQQKEQVRPYGVSGVGSFKIDNSKSSYRVKAFLKRNNEVVSTVHTNLIEYIE